MLIRPPDRPILRWTRKVPLKTFLTVPWLVQIVIVAGLTGWLSWWNGQQAVNRLASQLQDEIGDRIQLRLKTYLAVPQLITRINADAASIGQLDLQNLPAVERHLFTQLLQFESVSGILIGTEQGSLRAVNRRSGWRLIESDPGDYGTVYSYGLDGLGNRTDLQGSMQMSDIRETLWYQAAVKARKAVWSPISQTADKQDLSFNASFPIYDKDTGELLGVASAGVVLSRINEFLNGLRVSRSGLVFIVEHDGMLVGTSARQPTYAVSSGKNKAKLQRINALKSNNPLIRETAQYLTSRYGDFTRVISDQQLNFIDENGERNFVKVVPSRDEFGLDWLIVVVVPESDFMAEINANTRTTLLLCTGAVLVALAFGVAASNWMAKPMLRLSRASHAIAAGDLYQRVPEASPIEEIQITAQTFNQMAHKLSASFDQIESALRESNNAQKALYQREQELQRLNVRLEALVQERTGQLQQALDFEALLKRITDKMRNSLDEAQILQTAVRELAMGLRAKGCDIALYNLEEGTAKICCEHLSGEITPAQDQMILMPQHPDVYHQLLQGQCVQFCRLLTYCDPIRPEQSHYTILACPLEDDQGVLGDLWLLKPRQESFTSQEIRLVQQVANQCVIALRQSRLYQTAQKQVNELERLNHLKDDFLSTVSHELRTPISNIKLATQMLEISLKRLGMLTDQDPVTRYFQILKDEGQREITLINDLLDLSRLDAATEPLILSTIDPAKWLYQIVNPFIERACSQQQQLRLDIPNGLPPLTTDLSDLERVLNELLNNACKYTPAGEQITIAAKAMGAIETLTTETLVTETLVTETLSSPELILQSHPGRVTDNCTQELLTQVVDAAPPIAPAAALCFSITNSGVEIPPEERDRIFDKFYRIPSNDPWKHGGTGLGLALVKGLVERLQGQIEVVSAAGLTTFVVQLPLTVNP